METGISVRNYCIVTTIVNINQPSLLYVPAVQASSQNTGLGQGFHEGTARIANLQKTLHFHTVA